MTRISSPRCRSIDAGPTWFAKNGSITTRPASISRRITSQVRIIVSHGRHARAARFFEAVNMRNMRNVGMIQGREALRFAREPREAVCVVRE
jgi:hypothetical protein